MIWRAKICVPTICSIALILQLSGCGSNSEPEHLQISGIYPHLAAFNQPTDEADRANHRESGIGAVVPWAGKLWYITYPPHMRNGSNDKLHEIDGDLNLTIRPESVGGTHANRFVHRPTNQLIIGPYFIDAEGNVRAVDVNQLEGRMTATAEHLTDPLNKVLFYDMEGRVYEVNVHSLEATLLFEKPVPGWHGKGAYTAQGRFVVANNGEFEAASHNYDPLLVGGPSTSEEEAGVLAEWDGTTWRIVARQKFTEVTGPGGLHGSPGPESPLWTMGWDRRSVLLKTLDAGRWHTYRLPKGSHTFDPRHGWYTEWPRIRQIDAGRYMMVMHGTMFGDPAGRGGPWLDMPVEAGIVSDPYLMTGFDEKSMELSHDADETVTFTIEVAINHFQWVTYDIISVPAGETMAHRFPAGYQAHWVRLTVDRDARVTAMLEYG